MLLLLLLLLLLLQETVVVYAVLSIKYTVEALVSGHKKCPLLELAAYGNNSLVSGH